MIKMFFTNERSQWEGGFSRMLLVNKNSLEELSNMVTYAVKEGATRIFFEDWNLGEKLGGELY
jgi:hypothetical protein